MTAHLKGRPERFWGNKNARDTYITRVLRHAKKKTKAVWQRLKVVFPTKSEIPSDYYLARFKMAATFSLNGEQMDLANQLINIRYLGRPQLKSLTEQVFKEHEDASFNVRRSATVDLEVALDDHGQLIVIGLWGMRYDTRDVGE